MQTYSTLRYIGHPFAETINSPSVISDAVSAEIGVCLFGSRLAEEFFTLLMTTETVGVAVGSPTEGYCSRVCRKKARD